MRMLSMLSGLVWMGCTSTHRDVGMVTTATAEAEPHIIWTRPLEVGFEMGRYIEATVSTRSLLGLISVSEASHRSQVSMLGVSEKLSNAAQQAVAQAVTENNADGMYVLLVEEEVGWSGLIKETTTHVRGRSLKLEDFGSVDEERATNVRLGSVDQGSQAEEER